MPVMPASPDTLTRFAKWGVTLLETRVDWYLARRNENCDTRCDQLSVASAVDPRVVSTKPNRFPFFS